VAGGLAGTAGGVGWPSLGRPRRSIDLLLGRLGGGEDLLFPHRLGEFVFVAAFCLIFAALRLLLGLDLLPLALGLFSLSLHD
jgi:hypothetical protein